MREAEKCSRLQGGLTGRRHEGGLARWCNESVLARGLASDGGLASGDARTATVDSALDFDD